THRESDTFQAGSNIVLLNIDKIKIGFTICYDLRFPNLFRKIAKKGAQIILMPAAFTVPSGKAHWEVMLRSRAIENSLFIIATNMCGTHHTDRKTYGHSMLINPWGKIISQAKSKQKILNTVINIEEVKNVRNKIPAILND
ncbi:MAG: carbon-nitrogen hydrolase family protein, partial [Pelagibacteraceae bacterium]|nr:carbon-nitrogen hydrolase family protein [Pelagibacteraceae bacterium]